MEKQEKIDTVSSDKIRSKKSQFQAQLDALTKKEQQLRDEITRTNETRQQLVGAIYALDSALAPEPDIQPTQKDKSAKKSNKGAK